MWKAILNSGVGLSVVLCSGCATPQFDIPTDNAGQPTVTTIVARVECEIRDMVRDDMGDRYVPAFHSKFLIDGDYDVEIALNLDVNEAGGLAPNLSYMNPLSKATSFVFGGLATLSESRDRNFQENIQLSVRNIYSEWKLHVNAHDCPSADTNLAKELEIGQFVAIPALTPNLDTKQTLSGKGVFGGSDQFTVTKSVNSVGPTWSLVHFKGPGQFASLSRVNTDKITFSFAQGPNAGHSMPPLTSVIPPNPPNPHANYFLQQQLTSSVLSQLLMLQNNPPP